MADNTRKTTVKRPIEEVTLTLKVKAHRINENGTFSQFEVVDIKGPNNTIKASFPPMGGGSIYLKVESLEGIKVLEGTQKEAHTPKKLF